MTLRITSVQEEYGGRNSTADTLDQNRKTLLSSCERKISGNYDGCEIRMFQLVPGTDDTGKGKG